MKGERGAALIDVVCTAGLVAILAGIAVPVIHATRERDRARAASRYLGNRLQHARVEAVRRNARVAVRFDPDDTNRIAVYADGDGDGVHESDIDRGLDFAISDAIRLPDLFQNVGLRINQDVRDPEDGRLITAGSDPLRIGTSNLLSFSPLGNGTSGTMYIAAPIGPQMAVRVLGTTGRLRVLLYDAASGQWREE